MKTSKLSPFRYRTVRTVAVYFKRHCCMHLMSKARQWLRIESVITFTERDEDDLNYHAVPDTKTSTLAVHPEWWRAICIPQRSWGTAPAPSLRRDPSDILTLWFSLSHLPSVSPAWLVNIPINPASFYLAPFDLQARYLVMWFSSKLT